VITGIRFTALNHAFVKDLAAREHQSMNAVINNLFDYMRAAEETFAKMETTPLGLKLEHELKEGVAALVKEQQVRAASRTAGARALMAGMRK
jgi:hypothetical protein